MPDHLLWKRRSTDKAVAGWYRAEPASDPSYAAGVRLLKRWVIRLRWPAVVLMVLMVVVLTVVPLSRVVGWTGKLLWREMELRVLIESTGIGVSWSEHILPQAFDFDMEFIRPDGSGGTPRSHFLPGILLDRSPISGGSITCPLWYLALPPALLAFVGFRLKRREPKPGQCQRCRHPLAGAALCPECGEPAPAAAA
jgi:hypothetical protein